MDFVQYKCPCCGAALEFSPETQKLSCESCGNQYELETLKQYRREEQEPREQDLKWEYEGSVSGAERIGEGKYLCPSCGAEIEADENMASTTCPYCDNVVVIRAALSGKYEPDMIIPFQIKGERARQMFEDFCKDKRLLPKNFRDKSYLKNLKGYYVPYWLFDCKADVKMSFDATRVRAWSDSDYNYIDTSYYFVNRAGNMEFYHVPVDGSIEMEDDITESIEPFDYSGLTAFNPAYLAGYETDKYDVDAKTAEGRAKERLYSSAENIIRGTVNGYSSVVTKWRNLSLTSGKVHYVLLPVWLFESVYNGKKYQFAINGQTGKMVGELPVDKKTFWRYVWKYTAIGTLLGALIQILGGVL